MRSNRTDVASSLLSWAAAVIPRLESLCNGRTRFMVAQGADFRDPISNHGPQVCSMKTIVVVLSFLSRDSSGLAMDGWRIREISSCRVAQFLVVRHWYVFVLDLKVPVPMTAVESSVRGVVGVA